MDIGTESTTVNPQPSDILTGRLQPFEVKKSLPKGKSNKHQSGRLSVGEYQQLVARLHKTIEKTERQRLALAKENLHLTRRCRIQRKLVAYLRGVVTANTHQLADCEGQLALTRSQPVVEIRTQRVLSLNSALQKISGVEMIEESIEPTEPLAAIDLEDLQPIDEDSPAGWQRFPQIIINTTAACGKSALSIATKAGKEMVGRVRAVSRKPLTE